MTIFDTAAIFLTLAALGAYLNLRVFKLPTTVGIMLMGLMMSVLTLGLKLAGVIDLTALRQVMPLNFTDFLLHGVLSFLLFAGALHVNLAELQKYRVIIIFLATVGVVISTLITGTLVLLASDALGFGITPIYAYVFGALISPTDPVAVLGMLKDAHVRKSLRVKIASESLLNDGVGVVVFMLLLGIAADPTHADYSWKHIGLLLLREGGGSLVLGIALGWVTYRLLREIDDYKVEVMLTLALVMGGYALAECLHVSAPITMVAAGLLIGNHGRSQGMSEQTRQNLDLFWELLDDIINAVLFVMIGFGVMVVAWQIDHVVISIAAIVAVLCARFISVALPVYLMRFAYRFERGTIRLMTWGGLRGGISIALALALPEGAQRDLVLAITYATVVFSVLVQGVTFRSIARKIISG